MIARQVARGARKAVAEATRGYNASRRAGRKDTPQVTYHSPRPGEASRAPPKPPAAEAPASASSASSPAGASSGAPSASSAEAGGISASAPRTTPSSPHPPQSGGAGAAGTPASVPSGTPLPPERRGGVSPSILALAAGAGLGAYAYYSGAPFGDDAPTTSGVKDVSERERVMKDVSERGGTVREKETAGRDGPLAPAARRAAKMLLKKNDADADAEKRDVSDDVSASREKEKEDVSREDREVFGSAADAILAAADAAADAAARADEKDRAAKRRGSRAAAPPPRADQSELEGPALAARGKALEAVAATAAKDSTVSRLVRARSKQAKEEVAELTPTALVAASFQGAAEDIEHQSAAFRAMTFQAESDARAFAGALEASDRDRRKELAALEASLTAAHAAAAEDASRQIQSLASEIDRSERRVASLAAALTEAGEAAERAADAAAADAAATLTRSLKTQAAELKRAAAECLLRERIQRMEALDETRVAVNALTETLAVNSANLEASHKTLRLHVAVDALAEAAARGAATAEPVAALRACCAGGGAEGDAGVAFVEAVTATLVTRKDEDKGTPTVASLTNRLEDVRNAARRLALVPKTSGGVLTHLVSFLASTLRLNESVPSEGVKSSDDKSLSSSEGVEAALAAATHAMAAGRLAEAAAALEGGVKGSAAEALCAGWVKDARERQRLEMAVAALRAHAAAETATVA